MIFYKSFLFVPSRRFFFFPSAAANKRVVKILPLPRFFLILIFLRSNMSLNSHPSARSYFSTRYGRSQQYLYVQRRLTRTGTKKGPLSQQTRFKDEKCRRTEQRPTNAPDQSIGVRPAFLLERSRHIGETFRGGQNPCPVLAAAAGGPIL